MLGTNFCGSGPVNNEALRSLALDLLKTPSSRDKQRKIGPSLYASPCTKCVGQYLYEPVNQTSKYWLGARIGTAIHNLLEKYARRKAFRKKYPGALIEQKVQLGTLEGYGKLAGSADLVLTEQRMVVDYKTTDRDKIKAIKRAYTSEPNEYDLSSVQEARYKLQTYAGQMGQYARGLELHHDTPIDKLGIVFINRDGKTDSDVWAMTMDYDRDYAEKVWQRLDSIWKHVQENGVDDLESHPLCWPCNNNY